MSPVFKMVYSKVFQVTHKMCEGYIYLCLRSSNFVVTVFCHSSKFLLNTDELVVLRHTVGT